MHVCTVYICMHMYTMYRTGSIQPPYDIWSELKFKERQPSKEAMQQFGIPLWVPWRQSLVVSVVVSG